jgi:hypothetical protein
MRLKEKNKPAEQNTIGILAYGSLIHPEEFSRKEIVDVIPVKVRGFKRLFNQKPSWRKGEGNRIGVLNVEHSHEHTINAVCLCFESEHPDELNSRESGYTQLQVISEHIECYPGHALPEAIECYLFMGKEEMKRHDILPNCDYLQICMSGAKEWGEHFYEEFVETTYLANGSKLAHYAPVGRIPADGDRQL